MKKQQVNPVIWAFHEVPNSAQARIKNWGTKFYFLLFVEKETLLSEPGLGRGSGSVTWEGEQAAAFTGYLCPQLLNKLVGLSLQFTFPPHVSIGAGSREGSKASTSCGHGPGGHSLLAPQTCLQLAPLFSRVLAGNFRLGIEDAIPHPAGAVPETATKITLRNLSRIFTGCIVNVAPGRKLKSTENIKLARVCRRLADKSKLKSEATANYFIFLTLKWHGNLPVRKFHL